MVSLLIHNADKAVQKRQLRTAVTNTEPAAEIRTSPLPAWFQEGTVASDDVSDDKDSRGRPSLLFVSSL
jgi:hypothetical protein